MLLRHRAAGIKSAPANITEGFEHLQESWFVVLRWMHENRVEHVLVGPAADAIRGNREATGPVAIVPAPYRRNFERLSRALWAAHARVRLERPVGGEEGASDTMPVKLTVEKLAEGQRWMLRCGQHDLDIETHPAGTSGYQELLYEANRIQITDEISVEVASPEDLERYAQIRVTGSTPEIRITRTAHAQSA
ncbi:MAG: hypothetical protein JOY58_16945 [Solirubrobacterales bacterium]|nr:hypothetical protein [Solirubrobacterales bacterium]